MPDFLQTNKFGNLHNGTTIIFSRTDYIDEAFKSIKKIKNEVTLITGNSDKGVDYHLSKRMPDNITVWYCQNSLAYHNKIKSIPLGLENTFFNLRKGHGVGWPHAIEKINLLSAFINDEKKQLPKKFIYGNFNEKTNLSHRDPIRNICKQQSYITWDDPTMAYKQFINTVLDHQAVICPAGNGLDTHRIYEILYLGRIPITIKTGDYPIYGEIYNKLPIVILDDTKDLCDRELLEEKIAAAKLKPLESELLYFKYWEDMVLESAAKTPGATVSVISKFIKFLLKKIA